MGDERWRGRVYTAPSTIDGIGLFAAHDFKGGDAILRRDESRVVGPQRPLDSSRGELERHCDGLADGKVVLLPYPERHRNHSCDNNSFSQFIGGVGHIVASRDIYAGEELTNHYCLYGWGSGSWRCNCGSPRCLREVPNNFFELPLDRALELLPMQPLWFLDEHREQYEDLRRRAALV